MDPAKQNRMLTAPDSYQSLPHQVAHRIEREIDAQTWVGWLPGERTVAETLQVSRKTIRKAIAILQRDGRVHTVHGHGHEIVSRKRRPSKTRTEPTVGLIVPESLEQLRPFTALWVDALRAQLIEQGVRFNTFPGHRYFTQRPEKALARLVKQSPQDCWVLAHSNERVQQWFQEQEVPCVIAGSSHHGLDLPSVDLDYFAVCRHAAGVLLRHGHRRIGFLTVSSQRAGDLESEAGFAAGARQPTYGDVTPHLLRHDGTVTAVNRILSRIFDLAVAPTALLIANPVYYLTTVTFLAERRLRVPQDVSLISRDDDTFLAYLNPTPSRYSTNARSFAKRLMQPLLLKLAGEKLPHAAFRIEPTYLAGPSLSTYVTSAQ